MTHGTTVFKYDGVQAPVIAHGPLQVLPKGNASERFLASLAALKYFNNLPLARIEHVLGSSIFCSDRSNGWQVDSFDRAGASRLWDSDDGPLRYHQAPALLEASRYRGVLTPKNRVQSQKSWIFKYSNQMQKPNPTDLKQNSTNTIVFHELTGACPKFCV
jgi:hypothetical protein